MNILRSIESRVIKPLSQGVMNRVYNHMGATGEKFAQVMNMMNIGEFDSKRIQFFNRIGSLSNMEVLEIGIGTGFNAHFYKDARSLTGVDSAKNMLEIAKNKVDDAGIENYIPSENIPESQQFDLTVLTYVLTGTGDPSGLLEKALDSTKVGGRVAILDSLRKNRNYTLSNLFFIVNARWGVGYRETVWKLYYKNRRKFSIIQKEVLPTEDGYNHNYILILERI